MNVSQKYIRSSSTSLPKVTPVVTNAPSQYKDRQYQYLADRRTLFDEARDYLATDFVKARVQGLKENFFEWTETEIRLSDVSTQSVTAFDSKQYDDFKEILFRSRKIDYIPVGAYVETMGSIWMCVNPGNMSSPTTNAVIARCRAHWTFYDGYGNIQWEPLVIDRRTMLSNRNESPENLVLMEGYFNVKCQKNANTIKLKDNQRMILGNYAYHITGDTDFFEEFTGDDDSAHVINFTVRREEPEEHDDLINHIADGYLYEWTAELVGQPEIALNSTVGVTPHMLLNGSIVYPNTQHPQTWTYTSSNPNAITVTSEGVLEAVGEGSAVITATLDQNTGLMADLEVTVVESGEEIRFLTVVPPSIMQYHTEMIGVSYVLNGYGQSFPPPFEWTFSGANPEDYSFILHENGRTCMLTCNSPSQEPLVVTVSCGNATKSVSIELIGY